jgi:hypothetical protein
MVIHQIALRDSSLIARNLNVLGVGRLLDGSEYIIYYIRDFNKGACDRITSAIFVILMLSFSKHNSIINWGVYSVVYSSLL